MIALLPPMALRQCADRRHDPECVFHVRSFNRSGRRSASLPTPAAYRFRAGNGGASRVYEETRSILSRILTNADRAWRIPAAVSSARSVPSASTSSMSLAMPATALRAISVDPARAAMSATRVKARDSNTRNLPRASLSLLSKSRSRFSAASISARVANSGCSIVFSIARVTTAMLRGGWGAVNTRPTERPFEFRSGGMSRGGRPPRPVRSHARAVSAGPAYLIPRRILTGPAGDRRSFHVLSASFPSMMEKPDGNRHV